MIRKYLQLPRIFEIVTKIITNTLLYMVKYMTSKSRF